MKILQTVVLIAFFTSSSIAQETHAHCGYDSAFYAQDPITHKIEAGTPSEFIFRDTIMNCDKNKFAVSPTTERTTIWVTLRYLNGEELDLISTEDFYYNCEINEVEFLKYGLTQLGTVVEIHWYSRGNIDLQ